MSRQRRENKLNAEKLIQLFDIICYPDEYPWVMEFLFKVKMNNGTVNTPNQQDTLNVLVNKFLKGE